MEKFRVDEKYLNEIVIAKNVLPDDLYQELFDKYKNQPLTYGWKSHQENDPHGHWNVDIGKLGRFNTANIYGRIPDLDRRVWSYLSQNVDILKDQVLIRCYINGHTFGVDGYYHRDSFRQDETTTVLYLTDRWHPDWGGETVFVNDDEESPEIVRASLPGKNTAVMFNANIKHCGRGVSRKFVGIRLVYVLKGRKRRTDSFEKLSEFLFANGAGKKKHKVGTLHDHLMRVYQLLEHRGVPAEVSTGGGLHSVFGTNAFKNNIFTDEDRPVLTEHFGERSVFLAKLFSITNRPTTLENASPVDDKYVKILLNNGTEGVIDVTTFQELQMIECANLFDQRSLTIEKYPNLYRLWHGDQDIETNK